MSTVIAGDVVEMFAGMKVASARPPRTPMWSWLSRSAAPVRQ